MPEKAPKKKVESAFPWQIPDSLTLLEDVVFCVFFFSLALIFSTNIQVHFTLPKLAALRICAFFIVLLWIYRLKKGDIKAVPKHIFCIGLALGLWWLFSSFYALHKPTALHGVYGRYNALINHEIYLVLFFLVASMPMDMKRIGRILMLFISALTPVAIYAILQFYRIDPIPWPAGRSASTIGNPVILAALLGLAIPFILTFFLQSLLKGVRHWPFYFWGVTFLIFVYAAFTTLSRGPWWGMIFSTAVVIIVNVINKNIDRKKLSIFLMIFCVFGLVILSFNYSNIKRVTDSVKLYVTKKADTPLQTRFIYYKAAMNGIKEHPLTGVGFEGFRIVYPHYRPVEDNLYFKDVIPTMVHNGYLQTALTNGVPALILYLTLLALVLALLIKTYKKSPDNTMRFLCTGFIASIVGYLVQDIFGWLEIAISPFFWTVLGLGVALCMRDVQKTAISGWKRYTGYIFGFLCSVGLLMLCLDAMNRIHADRLFWKSQPLNIGRDWAQIESNIAEGLSSVSNDFYYEDMAGLLYLKRFSYAGDKTSYRQGVRMLEKSHFHNPFDVYVLIHAVDLETMALRKGIVSKASPFVEKAANDLVLMDKNNPTVYEAIARLRMTEKRFKEALEFVKRAQALKPGEANYYLFESEIYRALNDTESAINTYRKVIAKLDKSDPLPQEWVNAKLGITYVLLMKGDFNAALKEIDGVIERLPNIAHAHVIKGDIYGAMGNLEKSKESFATALKIEPNNPYAKRGFEQIEKVQQKPAGRQQ